MTFNAQQLYEIGRVFDPGPDPALYHPSVAAELLRRRLHASLSTGPNLLVLTGESGAGKTLLTRMMLRELPRSWKHVAQLSYSAMAGDELLRAIAYAFRLPSSVGEDNSVPMARLHACLEARHRSGEGSLLIVDEAHGLKADALRALHELSRLRLDGQAPLTILLTGSPGLLMRLDSPELAPLAEHFRPRFVLESFELRESIGYIKDRFLRCEGSGLPAFAVAALVEVHYWAAGVPGRINLLCRELLHEALLNQEDEQPLPPIEPERVAAKACELGFVRLRESAAAAVTQLPVKAAAALARPAADLWPSLAVAACAGLAGIGLIVNPAPPPQDGLRAPARTAYEAAAAQPTVRIYEPAVIEQASPRQEASRPRPARTLLASVQSAAPPARSSRDCAALLTQLSLGEPLTPKQEQTLETSCR